MSTGTIVVIVVIAIVVLAAAAVAARSVTRRRRLRQRFGPEYDRVVDQQDSRLKAEAELARRERRVSDLNIRPLKPAARARYTAEWATIQEQFVDAPQGAATQAQELVVAVMNERGYPTEHRDQVLADLSVEHAAFLDHYRAATDISERATAGTASTEDLRQAMIHYRALFQELLGEPADTGTAVADPAPAPAEAGAVPAEPGLTAGPGSPAAESAPVADTQPDPTHVGRADTADTGVRDPAATEPEAASAAADPRRRAPR